jgi:hypothetical protein
MQLDERFNTFANIEFIDEIKSQAALENLIQSAHN